MPYLHSKFTSALATLALSSPAIAQGGTDVIDLTGVPFEITDLETLTNATTFVGDGSIQLNGRTNPEATGPGGSYPTIRLEDQVRVRFNVNGFLDQTDLDGRRFEVTGDAEATFGGPTVNQTRGTLIDVSDNARARFNGLIARGRFEDGHFTVRNNGVVDILDSYFVADPGSPRGSTQIRDNADVIVNGAPSDPDSPNLPGRLEVFDNARVDLRDAVINGVRLSDDAFLNADFGTRFLDSVELRDRSVARFTGAVPASSPDSGPAVSLFDESRLFIVGLTDTFTLDGALLDFGDPVATPGSPDVTFALPNFGTLSGVTLGGDLANFTFARAAGTSISFTNEDGTTFIGGDFAGPSAPTNPTAVVPTPGAAAAGLALLGPLMLRRRRES